MMVVLYLKFTQNKDLFDSLINTNSINIVEFSPYDSDWGTHWKDEGENNLGKILMKLRDCLILFKEHFKILSKIKMPVV